MLYCTFVTVQAPGKGCSLFGGWNILLDYARFGDVALNAGSCRRNPKPTSNGSKRAVAEARNRTATGRKRTAPAAGCGSSADRKKDSTNSSKPPSSDHPATARRLKPASCRSRRKSGGQPDYPGRHRELVPLERVDQIVPLQLSDYRQCGHPLRSRSSQRTAWRGSPLSSFRNYRGWAGENHRRTIVRRRTFLHGRDRRGTRRLVTSMVAKDGVEKDLRWPADQHSAGVKRRSYLEALSRRDTRERHQKNRCSRQLHVVDVTTLLLANL